MIKIFKRNKKTDPIIQKKIDTMLFWYNEVSPKLELNHKKELLNHWISVFNEIEDYEISASLKDVLDKL